MKEESSDVNLEQTELNKQEAIDVPPSEEREVNELDKLRTEMEALKIKSQKAWDDLLRAKAEVENARRRARTDVENAHKYGIERFAKELLAVVDSLERGLESTSNEDKAVESVRKGLDLTYKQMIDTLDKFGISRISPKGEVFNPSCQEAISMQESAEHEHNTVINVIQPGFKINDRILRPALVVVAQEKK